MGCSAVANLYRSAITDVAAAQLISSVARGFVVRSRLRYRLWRLAVLRRRCAASYIQRAWSSHKEYVLVVLANRQLKAALSMQRAWRAFSYRVRLAAASSKRMGEKGATGRRASVALLLHRDSRRRSIVQVSDFKPLVIRPQKGLVSLGASSVLPTGPRPPAGAPSSGAPGRAWMPHQAGASSAHRISRTSSFADGAGSSRSMGRRSESLMQGRPDQAAQGH